jgi:glycosyltransferase involved in cell wall biosynthesis
MKVGVFHPGTQHSWQTALAFQETDQLAWYATSIFYNPNKWPYKIERYLPFNMRIKAHKEFARRSFPLINQIHVRHLGCWEWIERGMSRLGADDLASWCNSYGNFETTKLVMRLIEKESIDVLWSYNSSSLELFRWAKKRGIFCVLDQTTGHPATHNEILQHEFETHPEFFEKSFDYVSSESIERQNEECALADLIVVGSDFCRTTMIQNGSPSNKIRVVHYGFDETIFQEPKPIQPLQLPLQFLYVGHISARKGIAYLLKAFQQIAREEAQLTLVGGCAIPRAIYNKFSSCFEHIPSIPRSEVVRYFSAADCFVFPSLFEGSALVLYEACGSGLGIIQSQAGGHGVVAGRNGIILSTLSVDKIIDQVEMLIANPQLLMQWKEEARQLRPHFSWDGYRKNVRSIVLEACSQPRRQNSLLTNGENQNDLLCS